jgi:transposase InsO family protein
VAIVDLFSRNVLSWMLSNSLDTEFCLEALEMALFAGRKPEMFHSDQGCQFTSADFVARLQTEEIKTSWSGRNAATTTSSLNGCGEQSHMVPQASRRNRVEVFPPCLLRWKGG